MGQYQNAQKTCNWNLRTEKKRGNLRKEWVKDVSYLMRNTNPHIQEAQRTGRKVNKPKKTVKFIIRKLLKIIKRMLSNYEKYIKYKETDNITKFFITSGASHMTIK